MEQIYRRSCGMSGAMVDPGAVRAALDSIIDPCSAAAGAPAGLYEMGLVREVSITRCTAGGSNVRIVLCLTEPTCWMGFPFMASAREAVESLEGVSTVDISLADDADWDESHAQPDWRRRLSASRARRGIPLLLEAERVS